MTGIWVAIAAVAGYWFNELRHRREMGVKIIEIAVGILAEEPDKNKGLRDWAIAALAHYAEKAKVPLTEEAKRALKNEALNLNANLVLSILTRALLEKKAQSAKKDQSLKS